MRNIPDKRLTKNFMLYEFLEAKMPFEAIAMNWRHIQEGDIFGWELLALELQKLRGLVNENFKSDIGFDDIGIRITSGYRCKEWELLRGRSGESQHTKCAADFQPTNCSRELAVKILHWIYSNNWICSLYNEWWSGGLALKYPSKQGNILLIGFVHLDMRGTKVRWSYD